MNRKLRTVIAIIIAIIYTCLITSCQKHDSSLSIDIDKQSLLTLDSTKSDSVVDDGPVKGGVLNLFCTYPDTLDPLLTKNPYLQKYFSLIFDSMIKLDKSQKPMGQLCDKWYISEDGYTWTFHVREGIVWQDGFPFTAEDIKFTIEKIISHKQNSIYSVLIDNISSFKIVDRNTIEFRLKKPNAFTAELMTFPIISSRFYGKSENVIKAFNTKFPPGTGAYSFEAYEENESIFFTANKSWWFRKLNNNTEIPYIPEIKIKFFKNSREAFSAFQTGSIDIISVNDDDTGIYSWKTDVTSKKYANGKWDFISINLSDKILSDKVVRQFISSCINKSEIVGDILPGRAVESEIPLIPGSWLYETDEWVETLSNNEKKLLALNIDTKKQLIENGLAPKKLEILVNEENSDRIKVAEKVAQNLKNNGMEVTVNIVKWDKLISLVQSKKYDLAILGCTIPNYPDLSYIYSTPYADYQRFTATSGNHVVTNISGYKNDEVACTIENIYKSKNRDEIKRLFSELKIILNDEIPYIGLYFYYNSVIYNKNVRGNIDPYIWDEYNNIAEWYISGGHSSLK